MELKLFLLYSIHATYERVQLIESQENNQMIYERGSYSILVKENDSVPGRRHNNFFSFFERLISFV